MTLLNQAQNEESIRVIKAQMREHEESLQILEEIEKAIPDKKEKH